MKLRKKPIVIDGIQWFKHGDHASVRKTSYDEVARLLETSVVQKNLPGGVGKHWG